MLALYRRHRRECKAGHPEDYRSSEYDERKKGWKRCDCPIVASGTLNRKFRRQTTGQWEWEPARAMAGQWEASGAWGGQEPPKPSPAIARAVEARRTTITEATEAFLAKTKSRELASATHGKYSTFIKQFLAYTDKRGYLYIDQLTISDMDRFYASWPDNKRAKARKLNKLKSFMKFSLRRKWISEDISADLEPPEGHSIPANKSPFTDEEINRIISACDKIGGPIAPGPGHREWTGEDVKDFIFVMLYTGMRISDVSTFDTSLRLNGNDIFLRMHKTRKEIYTWVPDWLVERLRERERIRGPRIFALSKSNSLPVQTERWRLKLHKVFELAGAFTEKPVPHRFRHTFVRILLEKGIPVGDVAELVGDTERVLLRYYSKFVASRQQRLTNILREAFSDQPKSKVVSIR